jgi:DNA-binding response OmpR family regulator
MPVVLVVDDDGDLLDILPDILSADGWKVLAAPSASAALEVARSKRVDVVLTDLVMPDMDGQALEGAFRADPLLRSIPFVFMTAAVRQGAELAAARRLVKPFGIDDVVAMLRSCLPRPQQASGRGSEGPHTGGGHGASDPAKRGHLRPLPRRD